MAGFAETQDRSRLGHLPVLIVEDEPLIALALADAVEKAGGKVIGPVGSVSAALELLNSAIVAVAILDLQLSDGLVTPVIGVLTALEIPIIFNSADTPPSELLSRCPDVTVYRKPVAPELLIGTLAEISGRH